MARKNAAKPKLKLKLIESDEKHPAVTLKPGLKLDVVAVSLVTPKLIASKKIAARLCGGSGTCLAVIEIDKGYPLP